MTTDLAAFNEPDENQAAAYHHRTMKFDLGGDERRVGHIPYAVNFHPIALFLDDPSNTKIEVTGSSSNEIVAGDEVWYAVTSAEIMNIAYPITALRVTNTGSGSITVNAIV